LDGTGAEKKGASYAASIEISERMKVREKTRGRAKNGWGRKEREDGGRGSN